MSAPSLKYMPGAIPSTTTRRFIVVHYTQGNSVKAMLNAWKKPSKLPDGTNFYKGTNFSVDRKGNVVQWADPLLYYTNNTRNHSDVFKASQSVGIDFVKTAGQALTPEQVKAGSALIDYLCDLLKIPKTAAPDRTDSQVPLVPDSETPQYGVWKHRAFSHVWTECCGNIDIQGLLDYTASAKTKPKLVQAGQAESDAFVRKEIQ